MLKKICGYIKEFIIEEYKFLLITTILLIILNMPLNYYLVVGGGIRDANDRIEVEKQHKSKGSFNISYVTQLNANVLAYGLSFIIPSWEVEDADLYKYDSDESMDDINFRSELDLKTASGTATYWAYTLAKKDVKETSRHLYVIATYPNDYKTDLKVQDEILSMDGNSYDNSKDYIDYIQTKGVGDYITVRVKRKKKELDIKTKVYEKSDKKILGLSLQYVKEYKTDPKVNIKFKRNESGPSGGLITTLEIYNQLVNKDITKGKIIAGTGTIEEDGSIGQIGGIEHKVYGAERAKADVFLSPGGDNYKDAKKYIKEKHLKIKLIKVNTIQDAIKKLEEIG